MRTLPLDVDRLGPVQLRKAPAPSWADADQTTPKTEDGEAVYRGQIVLPGVATRRGGPRRPAIGSLKIVGGVPNGLEDGQFVALTGRWNVTAWNRAADRRNGVDAGAAFTVAPARDRETKRNLGELAVTTERPTRPLDAACPVLIGSELPLTYYGSSERAGVHVGVLALPADIPDQQGTVEVDFQFAPEVSLEWQDVRLVELVTTIISPLEDDRFGRAEHLLAAAGLERANGQEPAMAGATNGRKDRNRAEPQPETPTEPTEG